MPTKKVTGSILLTMLLVGSSNAFASTLTEKEVHSTYLNQKLKLISNATKQLKIPEKEAKKTSAKLLKSLMNNQDAVYKVDLFISDNVDQIESIEELMSASRATYIFNLDTNKSNYTLNGSNTTETDLSNNLQKQKQLINTKRQLRKENRRVNIQKIASILKKLDELSKVIEAAPLYITISLSRNELIALMNIANNEIRDYDFYSEFKPSNTFTEWETERDGYVQGVSLAQIHGVWNSVFPNTRGEDIGIYYSDVLCPADALDIYEGYTATNGDFREVVTGGTLSTEQSYHTRIITGVLGTVANEADLYCNDANLTGDDSHYQNVIPDDTRFFDIGITAGMDVVDVESYSLNRYTTQDNLTYTAMDAIFDHHSFENYTTPVFISAGNTGTGVDSNGQPASWRGNIVSPAKAFNVVTVGSYGRVAVGNQVISDFSAHIDPTVAGFNIRKPEVSAPGEHFHCIDIAGDETCSWRNEDSGTSFATPWTAALAADVMSQGSYWQSSAAMMKATVIAGASDPISPFDRDVVGEGGVDLFTMTWRNTNSAYWRDWLPNRPFTTNYNTLYDNNQCFTNWSVHLYDNREQRIVIAWLNDVDNANALTDIPNEYTLELLDQNGNSLEPTQGHEHHQGYQIINTSQPDDDYIVRVCQTNVNDGKRFDMGFTVSQRDIGASWWDQ